MTDSVDPVRDEISRERHRVALIARAQGLEQEVLDAFDANIAAGDVPAVAAWGALYEWDTG